MMAIGLDPERAIAYSPLGFLRDHQAQCVEHVALGLEDAVVTRSPGGTAVFYRKLRWDSEFFGVPVFRIDHVSPCGSDAVAQAAELLVRLEREVAAKHERGYVSAEVPAEDTIALQAAGLASFRLIETRVTYFSDEIASFEWRPRSPVRLATEEDISDLRAVAAEARNRFDRYHADPYFGLADADRYLAAYAEASIRGFADLVLVPNHPPGAPPGAFFTAQISTPPQCPFGFDHTCSFHLGVGRIPLVAVGPERHGWHLRLLAEMAQLFRERGVTVATMTTQATNRAVIRNCEKAGFRFGRLTHVFAWTPAIGLTA